MSTASNSTPTPSPSAPQKPASLAEELRRRRGQKEAARKEQVEAEQRNHARREELEARWAGAWGGAIDAFAARPVAPTGREAIIDLTVKALEDVGALLCEVDELALDRGPTELRTRLQGVATCDQFAVDGPVRIAAQLLLTALDDTPALPGFVEVVGEDARCWGLVGWLMNVFRNQLHPLLVLQRRG